MIEPSISEVSPESGAQLTPEQAIANLQSSDLSLRYYAAWWLGKFRINRPEAVEALIEALTDEADRTELGGYPLRRNAARALGKLGSSQAIEGLISSLNCEDFYVREAAAESLAMLNAKTAVPELIKMLGGGLAQAVQVPGRPHLVQPYEAVLEALGSLGATESIGLVKPFLEHSVPRVKCAAARAMYQLTQDSQYGEYLVEMLRSSDLKLQRVILGDLGAIGYMGAAEAIFQAKAENSFKLMALKGLLEHHLHLEDVSQGISESAILVMNLMDSLL